ncbi:MAG: VCBS repeat-containing protein, partial [bacterium]|nr:VCBS repeat-containing protein [bacterium]
MANEERPNHRWVNRGDGSFRNEALYAGCGSGADQDAGQFPAVETLQPEVGPGEQRAVFTEVAQESGLDFVHFNGMTGELFISETAGAGVALVDYDGDGDLDVYLVQGAGQTADGDLSRALFPPQEPLPLRDRLFRNDLWLDAEGRRHLRFTDVTEASGLQGVGYGMGAAVADYNRDGRWDLYITN